MLKHPTSKLQITLYINSYIKPHFFLFGGKKSQNKTNIFRVPVLATDSFVFMNINNAETVLYQVANWYKSIIRIQQNYKIIGL